MEHLGLNGILTIKKAIHYLIYGMMMKSKLSRLTMPKELKILMDKNQKH